MHTPSFFRQSRKPLRRGFTLMEMIIVLTIITLLLALVITNVVGIQSGAKEQKVRADILTLREALSSYEMESGSLPTTEQGLKALWVKPTTEPVPQNWRKQLKEETKDPWGHSYQYLNPGKHNPDDYDLYSMGPSGQPDAPDAIGNWENTSSNQ